jgi:serine/threonine protein kinase/tetratricopeptide (TPR) repeat protein
MPAGEDRQSLIGRQCLHYLVVERLGAGGMGVVFKAVDQKLGRNVALKFLPPYLNSDETLKHRLLQEAKAASALDHQNVGTVYGIEELEDGQMFIVMAYYEGETLADKIRQRAVPQSLAVFYACQVLEGLAEAHAKGVVHRDIKPSNILVTRQGVAKILDFGLAKIAGATAFTQTGTTLGTAAYMSPEQARGREAGQRSDLWSVGVVLYEILAGKLPFPGASVHSMMYAVIHEPPQPMEVSVAPDLDRIIQRALEKNPAERYPRAEEMLHDLQTVAAGIPLDSATRTLVVPSGTWSSGALAQSAPQTGHNIAGPASVPLERRRRWLIAAALVPILAAAALIIPSVRATAWTLFTGKLFKPSIRRVAVLPFRNIGDDPSTAALCDGLQAILTSRLASLQNSQDPIWVIPAGEVRRRKVTNARDAHNELQAGLAVDGTVMKAGQRLQLTVNLVDAASLRTIGSAVLSDPTGDFSSLEDQAIKRVAELLAVKTNANDKTVKASATVPAAYESYVKGVGFMGRFDKPESLDSAIAEFRNAIKTDPRFALAYAGLGEASRLKYRIDKDPKWLDSALENTKRAIDLNDQLAPAYVTLGRLHDANGQPELAVQEFQTALKLDPRNPDANLGLASTYERVGRMKEAEELFKQAVDLRPDFWDGHNRLAAFYARQGRYKDAEAEYRRAVQLAPDNALLIGNFGVLLYNMQNRAEARKMHEKSLSLMPTYSTYSNLGTLEFEDGHYAEAARMYEQALKMNDRDYHVWANLAGAYNWSSGWDAKARGTLERAAELAEKQRQARPNDAQVLADLATYHAKLGHSDQAMERLRQAKALAPDDVDVLFWTSEAYEEMGLHNEALAGLEKACKLGLAIDRIKRDPEFRQLQKNDRFISMTRKLEKPLTK